jgi:ABC-2 type transport system ATP-binding protein
VIDVDNVTKRFGRITAVDELSFQVDRGEVVGFLGPNGAGKTTTMRLLTGTLEPDDGLITFDDQPIAEGLREAKRRVGYLPEANPLYDEMLVCDYLEFAAELRGLGGRDAQSAVGDAASETNVGDVFFRPVGELSKGFRQRVGLAAAILHRPEILILDEPTEGLDPNQRVEIRRLVSELGRERTVILSTHVMQEAEATCSRLLIVSRGRLVADGSVADLLSGHRGGARYVVEAEGDGIADALDRLPGIRTVSVEEASGRTLVRLSTSAAEDPRPLVFRLAKEKDWTLWELHQERASLEQLFRELTADDMAKSGPEDDLPVFDLDPEPLPVEDEDTHER